GLHRLHRQRGHPRGHREPARPGGAGRDAARYGRLHRHPPAAGPGRAVPDPLPHRPGRDPGQGRGPDRRRGRLRHQALQPGRGRRPHPGRAAPHPRGQRDRRGQLPGGRRPAAGRGLPRGLPRRRDRGEQDPILFLTARDETQDKVAGLTVGGDDYVTKPFSLEEVVARIRAVLRRTHGGSETAVDSSLVVGDLRLDEDSHEVYRGDVSIELSPTEFKLLRYLMLNAGRVVSKTQILDHVWDYDWS